MKRDQIHTFKLFKESAMTTYKESLMKKAESLLEIIHQHELKNNDNYDGALDFDLSQIPLNLIKKILALYVNDEYQIDDDDGDHMIMYREEDSYGFFIKRNVSDGNKWIAMSQCSEEFLLEFIKILIQVPIVNISQNIDVFKTINESILPKDKSQLIFILSNILESLYQKYGIKDFYNYIHSIQHGVDNKQGDNAYSILCDLEYDNNEYRFKGFQRKIISGKIQWGLKPQNWRDTISDGDKLENLSEDNLTNMIEIFLKIPMVMNAINVDFYKDINESFNIKDFDDTIERIDKIEREINISKDLLNRQYSEKMSFMLESILNIMKEKHEIEDLYLYLDENWQKYEKQFENLENIWIDDYNGSGNLCGFNLGSRSSRKKVWYIELCGKRDNVISVSKVDAWSLYEIIQVLLSIPMVISSINVDLFKDINESFNITNIETEFQKLKQMENDIINIRGDFSPHKDKIIGQLIDILDKLNIGEDEDEDGLFNYLDKLGYGNKFTSIEDDDGGIKVKCLIWKI